jgi:uncharacterized membrane protein YdcZ (DUF606 family)
METITDILLMSIVIGVVIFLCRLIVKKKDSARTLPKPIKWACFITLSLGFIYLCHQTAIMNDYGSMRPTYVWIAGFIYLVYRYFFGKPKVK